MGRKKIYDNEFDAYRAASARSRRMAALKMLFKNGTVQLQSGHAEEDKDWLIAQPELIARNVKAESKDRFDRTYWVISIEREVASELEV